MTDIGARGWWRAPVLSAIILLTLVISPGLAAAGETETFRFQPYPLQVQGQERRTFTVNLETGESATDSVELTNKTEQPRRFRVYAADASVDDQGRVTVAGYTAPRRGVGSWMTVEDTEVALLPGTSQVIDFSVTRPAGEHASGVGAIVAEEIRNEGPSGGIELAFRVAIVVRLTGDPTGVEIVDPTLKIPLQLVPSDGRAEARVANHTTQTVDAVLQFTVEGLTGREWRLDAVEVTLGPGESVPVTQAWTTVPRWGGLFQVRAEAAWEAGSITSTGSRNFYPPLWLLAVAIVAVGIRGVRELWTRRPERRSVGPDEPGPTTDALRGRLIEVALWMNGTGRDAPLELRETTIAEAEAIAAQARRAPDGRDLERAALSLAEFARKLDDDVSARQAASDFDSWFQQHQDDPRVKEFVGS